MALRRVAAQAWTYEDYCRIPADGRRYELHEGELWMAPSPTTRHQRIVGRIFEELSRYVQEQRLGEVFIAPLDVVLASDTVVQPDLVFVSRVRRHIVTEENIQGAPDLLVEVMSPGTRALDRARKRGMYQQAGVPEYWVVDGDRKEVAVYSLDPQRRRYESPTRYQAGEAVLSVVMKGLRIPLAGVWA
jgi:Uma2 family endonuclease